MEAIRPMGEPPTWLCGVQIDQQAVASTITLHPGLVAVLPAAALRVAGGFDVLIDLLYRLENEFVNWSETLVPAGSIPALLPVPIREESFVFTILDLQSHAQLDLANQILRDAAEELGKLRAQSCGKPVKAHSDPGGTVQRRTP